MMGKRSAWRASVAAQNSLDGRRDPYNSLKQRLWHQKCPCTSHSSSRRLCLAVETAGFSLVFGAIFLNATHNFEFYNAPLCSG